VFQVVGKKPPSLNASHSSSAVIATATGRPGVCLAAVLVARRTAVLMPRRTAVLMAWRAAVLMAWRAAVLMAGWAAVLVSRRALRLLRSGGPHAAERADAHEGRDGDERSDPNRPRAQRTLVASIAVLWCVAPGHDRPSLST
jgi:hypothetical protein